MIVRFSLYAMVDEEEMEFEDGTSKEEINEIYNQWCDSNIGGIWEVVEDESD